MGEGRSSKVYKAREVMTKKIIAVKMFGRGRTTYEDKKQREAIKKEVEMLAAAQGGVSTPLQDVEAAIRPSMSCSIDPCKQDLPKTCANANDTISLTSSKSAMFGI